MPENTARKRTPRVGVDIDLAELAEYAELFASIEDAAAMLSMGAAALQRLVDDPDTPQAAVWRQGRARARLNVRRAQFALMEKNATLAIHLGKEILGQDGPAVAGPVTFNVDTGIHRNDPEKD